MRAHGLNDANAPAQVLQSGQFDLSAGEVERLAAQVEAHPSGDIPYSDWIAALIDWRAVQVTAPVYVRRSAPRQHLTKSETFSISLRLSILAWPSLSAQWLRCEWQYKFVMLS